MDDRRVIVPQAVLRQLRKHKGLPIQVRGVADGAKVAELVKRTLDDYCTRTEEIAAHSGLRLGPDLGGPKFWEVIALPDGPVAYIDSHDISTKIVLLFPELLADALTEAGFTEAQLTVPEAATIPYEPPGPAAILFAVQLEPHGPRHLPFPAEFSTAAAEWVARDLDAEDTVECAVVSVGLTVPRSELEAVLSIDATWSAMSGDESGNARFASRRPWEVALDGGGPSATSADLLSTARELIEVAHKMAPVCSQAFVYFAPTLENVHHLKSLGARRTGSKLPSIDAVVSVSERAVYEPVAYHVLSDTHYEHLTSAVRARCVEIAPRRYGLAIGSLEDWLPDSRTTKRAIKHGREMLAPLMLNREQIDQYRPVRWQRLSAEVDQAP